MISIVEFLVLPVDEQAQYVWENGSFLVKRKGKRIACLVYMVDNYYVEIWYNIARNKILVIVPFDDNKRLAADLQAEVLLKIN